MFITKTNCHRTDISELSSSISLPIGKVKSKISSEVAFSLRDVILYHYLIKLNKSIYYNNYLINKMKRLYILTANMVNIIHPNVGIEGLFPAQW